MIMHTIIRLISLLPVIILLFSCQQGENKEADRPNIIFLLTDDQRDNTMGSMGHPWVETPNIDQLVREGVRFSNTYIAEPTCSPSRVSIFTGMHERINGIGFTSSYQLTEEQWGKTYPALLRGAGYYTGFIGKFGEEYYTFRGRASDRVNGNTYGCLTAEQLFNLEEDPGEYLNLIDEYEGSAFLQDIREKCMKYSNDLNRQRDTYKKAVEVQLRE